MHRADPPPSPMVRFLAWADSGELDLDDTAGRLDRGSRDRLATSTLPAARRFLIGRALLIRTIIEALDVDAGRIAVTAVCPDCGLAHGRPQVRIGDRTVHASVSHAADASAVALSVDHPVGVDVERLDASRFAGIESVALSLDELERWHRLAEHDRLQSLAESWTAKEAVVKALGTGLRTDPASIAVAPTTSGGVIAAAGHRVALAHPAIAPGYVVATALLLD